MRLRVRASSANEAVFVVVSGGSSWEAFIAKACAKLAIDASLHASICVRHVGADGALTRVSELEECLDNDLLEVRFCSMNAKKHRMQSCKRPKFLGCCSLSIHPREACRVGTRSDTETCIAVRHITVQMLLETHIGSFPLFRFLPAIPQVSAEAPLAPPQGPRIPGTVPWVHADIQMPAAAPVAPAPQATIPPTPPPVTPSKAPPNHARALPAVPASPPPAPSPAPPPVPPAPLAPAEPPPSDATVDAPSLLVMDVANVGFSGQDRAQFWGRVVAAMTHYARRGVRVGAPGSIHVHPCTPASPYFHAAPL